jgi:hypothetical protein
MQQVVQSFEFFAASRAQTRVDVCDAVVGDTLMRRFCDLARDRFDEFFESCRVGSFDVPHPHEPQFVVECDHPGAADVFSFVLRKQVGRKQRHQVVASFDDHATTVGRGLRAVGPNGESVSECCEGWRGSRPSAVPNPQQVARPGGGDVAFAQVAAAPRSMGYHPKREHRSTRRPVSV